MWLSHMQRQHLRSVIRQFPFLVCPFTRVTNEMLVQQHFSECWQECPLTLNSKRSALFYVQEPLMEPARWNNSSGDICTGQPARPVSSHFFLLSVGQSISAFSASPPPSTDNVKRSAFRRLNFNDLTGTIPAQISALVELEEL